MSFQFRHILVPVDITGRNRRAAEIARSLAAENQARVTLLHVIQTIGRDEDEVDEETQRFYEHLQTRIAPELSELAEEYRAAGVDVTVETPVGNRLREIAAFSNERDVDLIVMSSHRINPDDLAASWGTLSYRVSVVCETPILLVK